MAYDGQTWNEASPVNSDLAADIDDYIRDGKIAVRSRLEHEHIWSSSQTATGSDGQHRFITLTTQTSAPSLVYGTSTQAAAIYANTDNNVYIMDKTNVSYMVVKSAVGPVLADGTGTSFSVPYIASGTSGGTVLLAPPAVTSGTNYYMSMIGTTATAPTWSTISFGTWTDKSSGYGAQQATADGFVVGYAYLNAIYGSGGAFVYTDANSDPTTLRGAASVSRYGDYSNVFYNSFMVPVRKNDYWKVVSSGTVSSIAVYWIPAK